MNTAIYKIEALTNIHVGSGDTNYGVIDNLVQRDVTTNYPTINGSSLKGALKEYFESKKFANIKDVFGDDTQKAGYRFLSAKLLAVPARSNKKSYFMATCPAIIKQFNEDVNTFKSKISLNGFVDFAPSMGKPIIFTNDSNGLFIEDFTEFETKQNKKPNDCSIFGDCENLVILNDEDFIELVDDFNLPVVARNKVAGDKNLWYEQVVPSKSLFYFVLIYDNNHITDFDDTLKEDIIHIGANATVGYGFTKISKL